MRNFEERMAEISRRSEKILAKRKNRRRMILVVCIPLVLCVGILALTRPTGTESKQASMATNVPKPEAYDGSTNTVTGIQISGGDISLSYTDAQQIQLFRAQLDNYTSPACGYAGEDLENSKAENAPEDDGEKYYTQNSIADESIVSYTITFVMDDGSMTQFRLIGSILENLTTGEVFVLTDEQASQLNQLLAEP